MQWTKCLPAQPGLYWIFEPGEEAFLARVDVESDSHAMFFVQLPDEDYKYPLDLWVGAFWRGPLEPPG